MIGLQFSITFARGRHATVNDRAIPVSNNRSTYTKATIYMAAFNEGYGLRVQSSTQKMLEKCRKKIFAL